MLPGEEYTTTVTYAISRVPSVSWTMTGFKLVGVNVTLVPIVL